MTAHAPEGFPAHARAALADGTLRGALARATETFAERRTRAVESVPDWEELREQARAVKEHTLLHLDRYLEQFVARAEEAGVVVHWARDAREACAVVAALARGLDARRLVKSKSMTTEEIGLNAALERDGSEPVETDLGEWIIQLAGETPSHIIVPAIHKTRAQISELFVEQLGRAPTDDVQVLAGAARAILRRHFAAADLGISGVNFGVAETGTILILENEGNARMTTSLPRAHVAVMGIEKIVPRQADLEVFLRLLPRSGTGQHLTSYQSLLTGPETGSGPGESHDGPRELHLVLLDNGRSALLAHELTRQTLACIRCGACLNACPVYGVIGGHAYGSVYPGPIGAILTPQLPPPTDHAGGGHARHLPFVSSLCGACRDVCPVKIDIPRVLLELRARIVAGRALPAAPARAPALAERLGWRAWAWACSHPRRFARCAGLLRVLGRLVPLERLFPPLRAWSRTRAAPVLAARSFRAAWREQEPS